MSTEASTCLTMLSSLLLICVQARSVFFFLDDPVYGLLFSFSHDSLLVIAFSSELFDLQTSVTAADGQICVIKRDTLSNLQVQCSTQYVSSGSMLAAAGA